MCVAGAWWSFISLRGPCFGPIGGFVSLRGPCVCLRGLCDGLRSSCADMRVPSSCLERPSVRLTESCVDTEMIFRRLQRAVCRLIKHCGPVRSSHRGHRVAAAETHLPASFMMIPIDQYKLILASTYLSIFIRPFRFY